MRAAVVTLLTVVLSAALTTQSPTQTAVYADRVVVLKKERKLELYSQGKAIKTYKVALGGEPIGPKTRQGDHRTPRGSTSWIFETPTASFTRQSTFRTRASVTARLPASKASRREGTCSSTDCPTAMARLVPLTVCETGRTAASP